MLRAGDEASRRKGAGVLLMGRRANQQSKASPAARAQGPGRTARRGDPPRTGRVTRKLRPAVRSDLPAIRTLLGSFKLQTEDLEEAPGLKLWVIKQGRTLLGVVGFERYGAAALLRSLGVDPEFQGRGLGTELIVALEDAARNDGVEILILLTTTAERFFRSLGYDVVDRTYVPEDVRQSAEFRSLCPVSAICMTKALHR